MPIDIQAAIADIDDVLGYCSGGSARPDATRQSVMLKACILRWAPAGSPYQEMAGQLDPFKITNPLRDDRSAKFQAVLACLRRDFAKGMVKTFEEMVHASMFDDLLGQAQGLWESNHLQAAVVVAGATLESHLRELAAKHQVPTTEQKHNKTVTRMASALNDELHAKAKAYSTTEFRQVQVWIDLRNEAAHGRDEFKGRTANDVGSMITGIREFMVRNPA